MKTPTVGCYVCHNERTYEPIETNLNAPLVEFLEALAPHHVITGDGPPRVYCPDHTPPAITPAMLPPAAAPKAA